MKYLFTLFFLIQINSYAQSSLKFQNEVLTIQKKYDSIWDSSKETIVFTGSSSIRFWYGLEQLFPKHQIVNSGFGGSQASDLLAYSEELVLRFNPKKVFIYEGDNDIYNNKKPKEIVNTLLLIIHKIRKRNKQTQIILISTKPSISRWHLKQKYKVLNRKFKRLSRKDRLIEFADVWGPMIDNGKLKQDIFIKDGLHLNEKGYSLWYNVLKKYVD